MRNIAILGSSGSIGKNALWAASRFPEELGIFGLSVHSDIDALSEQIALFHPEIVCVADKIAAAELARTLNGSKPIILSGEHGLEELASHPQIDIVINSVVGFAGLKSTLAAAGTGKRIALANKESMVAGGRLVKDIAESHNAEIIPVDSEHSAIFQCLKSGRTNDIRRLILTSSGGPFRNYPVEKFREITVDLALKHPTWSMGRKITIDSATLMNKGLEIIEAVYLFDFPEDRIDVVIHPQSVVHSMVEYIDGSVIAQLSRPDMRLPIEYALFYPERRGLDIADLDFNMKFSLDFEPPDNHKFPSLNLARQAVRVGNTAPAIFNAANEIAVDAFLNGFIDFPGIFSIVDDVLSSAEIIQADCIESIIEADIKSRESARTIVGRFEK